MSPAATIRDFAESCGWGQAEVVRLAQDASARHYWRLREPGRTAVVMDAGGDDESLRPFLAVGALLRQAGLSVPAVLASEDAAGLLLLEDFGDDLFAAALAPQTLTERYDAAVDALAVLGRLAPPELPRWGPAEMTKATAATFLDWWWPATFGVGPDASVIRAFEAAMTEMLAPLQHRPPGLTHRDFFAGNLFWLPARNAGRRIGIIDFQDASLGSPAYDLVSLVQDARRDLPADLAERASARLLAARPELEPAPFRAAFAACAAQRHLRVAALWVRLARRDGKPGYLKHGPRCWSLLAQALHDPATAPLAAFLDRHVPPALRCNPKAAAA